MQGYGEFRFPGDGTKRAFGEFYENMSRLDENVTLEQAITLRQMFNDFLTNFKSEFKGNIPREEAQAIGNLAARLEFDLLNLKNVDNAIDETMPEEKKEEKTVDIDTSGPGADVELPEEKVTETIETVEPEKQVEEKQETSDEKQEIKVEEHEREFKNPENFDG